MIKAKSIAAGAIALTVALGGGALWAAPLIYAATDTPSSTAAPNAAATPAPKATDGTQTKPEGRAQGEHGGKRGGFGFGRGQLQQQLAAYLGLTEAELRTRLEAETLAEVAAAQGKTRETLKAQLIEWLEASQAEKDAKSDASATDSSKTERPAFDAAAVADKLLDSQGQQGKPAGKGGKGECKQGQSAGAAESDQPTTAT